MKQYIIKIFSYLFSEFYRVKLSQHFLKKWNKLGKITQFTEGKKPRILFLPVPILNNKYWAKALKSRGYKSNTLMSTYYSISKKDDFDYYFEELKEKYRSELMYRISSVFGAGEEYCNYRVFEWCIENYDVFCMPFTGGVLSYTRLKGNEAQILESLGCKMLTFAYGSDYFQYSKVLDPSYRHAIISAYPEMGKIEYKVFDNYKYWAEYSHFVMGSMAHDGLGRWDMLPVNFITIDTIEWKVSGRRNNYDGINNEVIVTHSPNHRQVKGTEFIVDAIKQLNQEGLKVKLLLLENISNQEVKRILETEADIHVEQIIYCGYALSAIEGMASALPVISNEENEITTRVLRRYSFLNECPILSSSPEKIKDSIRLLVRNPELRDQLGNAGRKYVEKYHSENSAVYMFERIFDKICYNKDIDLINLFHPIMPHSYNNLSEKICHPLVENMVTKDFLNKLKS